MNKRRVVITGLGLMTPCGKGWQAYWKSVLESRSHISPLTGYAPQQPEARLAGQMLDFDPSEFIKQRKSLKLMSREIQLAVAASHLAIQDAQINMEEIARERFGISLGTGIINNDLDEVGSGIRAAIDENGVFQMSKFGQEGIRALYPLWFLKYLPNMPACHISIAHNLMGPSNTVTTSSAAGGQAIGEAFRVIQRNDADLMLCGSTDSKINAMGISRFHLLGLLSDQNRPEKAYRPFDVTHDGIILGEGAGLIVLEEYEHAKKRGARIYGEIAGYGSSSDFGYNPAASEDYTGKRLAMMRALEDAAVPPADIDCVMANGCGVPQQDIQEAMAVQAVFDRSLGNLSVSAVKPITGHLVYGSAGVEISAAVLSLFEKVVPPVTNLETPAPQCQLPFIQNNPKAAETRQMLLNSFGFGGQNASLVLRKV